MGILLLLFSAGYTIYVISLCAAAGLVLLGAAGLIAYFITRGVFKHKGRAKPKPVWFILPTVVMSLGVIFLLVLVLVGLLLFFSSGVAK